MLKEIRQNCGRTMLEMLSVLAIIGILTAVGLSMYKNAIYSHKANIILNDTRMIAATVLQKETIVAEEDGVIPTAEYRPETPYNIYALEIKKGRTFAVALKEVEENVCKAILDKAGNNYSLEVQDTAFDGDNTNICKEKNYVKFMFDLSGLCNTKCSNCCYGVCCPAGEVCYEESRSCGIACEEGEKPFGTATIGGSICCPEETKSICGKNCCEEESTCCGGKCCPSGECSDFETGECCGTDKNGLQLKGDREAKECICPGGMELSEDICRCPAGYFYLDGDCVRMECASGCTNGNCTCYLINVKGKKKRCGAYCNSNGTSCSYGSCVDIGQCPEGNLKYISQFDLYGCQTGNVSCYYTTSVSYVCYLDNLHCGSNCSIDGKSCRIGDCENKCESEGLSYVYSNDYGIKSSVYGCYDNETGIFCQKNNYPGNPCYKNGLLCGSNCDLTGKNCAGNSGALDAGICYDACPAPLETKTIGSKYGCYNSTLGVFCSPDCGGYGGGSYRCYISDGKTLGSQCAERCSVDGSSCYDGTCNPNVCTSQGLTFEKIDSYRYGCYDETTRIACYHPWHQINCAKDFVVCGVGCSDWKAGGDKCLSCHQDYQCPEGSEYYIPTNRSAPGGHICYNKSLDIYCDDTYNGSRCTIGGLSGPYCGWTCEMNSKNCQVGSCEDNCPEHMVYGPVHVFWHTVHTVYGCNDLEQQISCHYDSTGYSCWRNGMKCGSGCDVTGKNCSSGICNNSDCEAGGEVSYDSSTSSFKCTTPDHNISCVHKDGDSYTCSINNNYCGYDCEDEEGTNCSHGVCSASECPTGFSLQYVNGNYYGCYNSETHTICYKDGSTYTCYKKGSVCGTECDDATGKTCKEGATEGQEQTCFVVEEVEE